VTYLVSLTASAERELDALPAAVVARIVHRLESLASTPRPPGCKKLTGGGNEWRIRIGDYRAVYEINDTGKRIDVTRIAHRREVYR